MMSGKFNEYSLEFLRCPVSGQRLSYNKKENMLVTKDKINSYLIKDGIPILIPKDKI